MIQIDPWAYIYAALLILILPLDWLVSALCAAIFHELCHVIAIISLGGNIRNIRIGLGGVSITTALPGKAVELICALSGPIGSFFLISLCHIFPKIAICACLQGMFNLLPIYPLDGGRILHCALELICPSRADPIKKYVEIIICLIIVILAAAGAFLLSLGVLPLFAAGLLIIKAVLRKRPCKQSQIRVQ